VTRLRLRVHPKARKNAITGLRGDALKVSVTAPPDQGKANEAVLEVLAAALGIPASSIALVSGAASRDKVVEVDLDTDEIARRLA
jgi:uncharacterized protein